MSASNNPILEVISWVCSEFGYDDDNNPWTRDTKAPGKLEIEKSLDQMEEALQVRFPDLYREFVMKCADDLINNGYLVPWPSDRNILDINKDFYGEDIGDDIDFWHEESGSTFSFDIDSSRDLDTVIGDGDVVFSSFGEFLRKETARRIGNLNYHKSGNREEMEKAREILLSE